MVRRLPYTLKIAVLAMGFTVVMGLGLGILMAAFRDSWVDRILRSLTTIMLSIPGFWLAILLIFLFCEKWQLLPSSGYSGFASLLLPSFSVACSTIGVSARLTRTSILDELGRGAEQQDYDDVRWETVCVPHDWSIEGSFREDEAAGGSGGYLPTGIGWYRTTFAVEAPSGEAKVFLGFDGVYPDVTCVLGNGTAIDPQDLLAEMRQLEERGVSLSNLRISLRAHLVMPYHKILDTLMEAARGREDLGTPRRGIGPCYMDKVERIGLRVCDLLHPDEFAHKVKENVKIKNRYITKVYGGIETVDADAVVEQYLQYGRTLKPYMADASLLVYTAIQSGQTVIFEGAQATMLDVGMGTYPYVTSSHSAAGGVCIGAGIGPRRPRSHFP